MSILPPSKIFLVAKLLYILKYLVIWPDNRIFAGNPALAGYPAFEISRISGIRPNPSLHKKYKLL